MVSASESVDRRDFLKSAPIALLGGMIPGIVNGKNEYPMEVVDIHLHLVGESESNGCFVSSRSRRSVQYKFLRKFLVPIVFPFEKCSPYKYVFQSKCFPYPIREPVF